MMICIEKDKNDRLMFVVKHEQAGSRALEVRPCFMKQLTEELTAYLFENESRPVENDPVLKSAIDMIHSAHSV